MKVSQIRASVTAKAFLLLEVDFAGSALENTISTDTGEPDQLCLLKAEISGSFSPISQSIAGPEAQIAEVMYFNA